MNKNASNFYPTQQFHMFLHIVKLSEIESSPIKNTSWTAKVEFMWIHGRFTKLTPSKILLVTFCLAPWGKFRPLPQRFKQNVIEFFRGSPTISKFLLHFCGKNLLDRKNLCVVLSLRWDFWGFGQGSETQIHRRAFEWLTGGVWVWSPKKLVEKWRNFKVEKFIRPEKRCMYTYFERYNW